jgi:hypothetical protein
MVVSDEDGTAERLAQVRARRLRVAERRDAAHEGAAAAAARGEAEQAAGQDPQAAPRWRRRTRARC